MVRKFLIDYKGEEDEYEVSRATSRSDTPSLIPPLMIGDYGMPYLPYSVLYMIPWEEYDNALPQVRELTHAGVPVFFVKYKLKKEYKNYFAAALPNYHYPDDPALRGFVPWDTYWWQIVYDPRSIKGREVVDVREFKDLGVEFKLNSLSDFDYFEFI